MLLVPGQGLDQALLNGVGRFVTEQSPGFRDVRFRMPDVPGPEITVDGPISLKVTELRPEPMYQ